MVEFIIGAVVIVVVSAWTGWRCYNLGVKDTERRWSDAVERAEYHRRNSTNTLTEDVARRAGC